MASLVQRSQWPHERVNSLVGAGRRCWFRGSPLRPKPPLPPFPPVSTCLRAAPSCGHPELACKFKCEPQPPIIIISLYRQRCRGGALAGREEGSQAPPEPPRDCKAPSSSSWARETPALRRPRAAQPPRATQGSRSPPRAGEPRTGPSAHRHQPRREGQAGARGALFPN